MDTSGGTQTYIQISSLPKPFLVERNQINVDTSKDVDISGGTQYQTFKSLHYKTVFSGEKPNKNVELVVGPK